MCGPNEVEYGFVRFFILSIGPRNGAYEHDKMGFF